MGRSRYRMGNRAILLFIVASAFAARAVSIWLYRPEFVGWFNHCYYYWVQAKGILESSQLPYADLPLLFYFYAAVTSLFQLSGMELSSAIVNSSRFVMSIAPALIAVPVYLLIHRMQGSRPLASSQWILVAVAAFLPLTFAHMPELLQKNTFGLLLLSGLMYTTYALLQSRATSWLIVVLALFILIALTHLGTLAVALLFGTSLLAAFAHSRSGPRQLLATSLVVVALATIGLTIVCIFDADAYARILRYALSSVPNSLIGELYSSESLTRKLMFLAAILLPVGLLFVLLRTYKRNSEALPLADRIFWLGNVLLAYVLVLPVFDLSVVPRLVLFMPLPLLIVVAYHLQYHKSSRQNRLLLGLASLGVVTMLIGESVNLLMLYPDKDEIHVELVQLRQQYQLSEDDLVLTQYGVNPICNWFLGTRSGLITAFNKNDWGSYKRIFVLDPQEGQPATRKAPSAEISEVVYLTEEEKYVAMRRSIPMPPELVPLTDSEHLTFYELHAIPENWLFSTTGDWIGYVRPSRVESLVTPERTQ